MGTSTVGSSTVGAAQRDSTEPYPQGGISVLPKVGFSSMTLSFDHVSIIPIPSIPSEDVEVDVLEPDAEEVDQTEGGAGQQAGQEADQATNDQVDQADQVGLGNVSFGEDD